MREQIFKLAVNKTLKSIATGKGRSNEINPSTTFTTDAKAGKFDALSDDDYVDILAEVEDLSTWWKGLLSISAIELLDSILTMVKPDGQAICQITDILAEQYVQHGYQFMPEISHPELLCQPSKLPFSPVRNLDRSPFPEVRRGRASASPAASEPFFASPQNIFDYITDHIHGQRDACRAAASLLYHHIHGHRRSMLMVGPTGCGKTEIWRVCQSVYPHIIIVDANQLTAEGWSGSFKIRDIFNGLSPQEIEQSIVIIDEFDKMCEPKIAASGTNHSHVEQDNLLKLIEGNTVSYPQEGPNKPAISFDSRNVSFVFLGAFELLTEMKSSRAARPSIGFGSEPTKPDAYGEYSQTITPEDVTRYSGMRREIAGRIGSIVQLRPMTEQDYREILHDNTVSPIRKLEREYDIRIHFDDLLLRQLAREAADTKMGVRYLTSRVQDLLDTAMFQAPQQKEYYIETIPDIPAHAAEAERSDTL